MSTPETPTTSARAGLEPGSFRDPESRVFYAGDDVYRALSADGLTRLRGARGHRAARRRARRARPSRCERRCRAARACSCTSRPGCSATSASRSSRIRTSGRSRCSRTRRCSSSTCCWPRSSTIMVLKDSTPYNVQFKGARPVFVDVGSFERHARGRAVGRLPPVLHALPLPAAAPGGEGRAVPALAARLDRRHHAQSRCAPLMSFRDRFRSGVFTQRLPARPARGDATPTGRSRSRTRSSASSRRSCSSPTCARCASSSSGSTWDPPEGVWTAYGERNSYTDDDARRKDDFVREVATSRAVEPRLGHRRQQRPLLADRRRGRAHGGRRRRRPGPGRAALPRPARRGQRADPHAHDEPRRPVARPRLARPRAQVAARPRQAGPGARARPGAPRRDQRQRAREGVRRLARLARHGARDRVPHPRGPDGEEAARPQARRPPPGLRARLLRAHLERGVRGRAQRAPRVGHARALLRAPQDGDEPRRDTANARPAGPT